MRLRTTGGILPRVMNESAERPLPPSVDARRATVTPLKRQRPRRTGFWRSFVNAYEGLLVAMAQRNMKFHVVSAVLVGLVGSGIRLELAEKVTLIFCVLLVFFAEILNTSLEALVDLHTEDFEENARKAKDTAAAAVLVLAAGTVVIFAALVVHNWAEIVKSTERIARQAMLGGPLALVTGALLVEFKRPAWVDHALFVAAAALCVGLWSWSVSSVFSTLTGLLVWLSWRAARRIHA